MRRLRSAGSAAVAVVGVATALFGAYAAYLTLPQQISAEDWTRRTNAICEKSAADLRANNFGAVASDLNTASQEAQDSADAYRLLVGQVRELEPPEDARRIDALLVAGAAVYRGLDQIAGDLR